MKHTQSSRDVTSIIVVDLEDVEPVALVDGRTVFPAQFRITYRTFDGQSWVWWAVMANPPKKDGTPGKAVREILDFHFRSGYGPTSQDLTPAWIAELIEHYRPADMESSR